MSAKIINLAERRRERAKATESTVWWPLVDAGLLMDSWSLMWLEALETFTEPKELA